MHQSYVLRVHALLPRPAGTELYPQLLDLLENITPTVQALQPDAADIEIGTALRFFDRTPHELAQLIRLRTLALLGLNVTIGGGRSRLIAAMAADTTTPGTLTCIDPADTATRAFLRPRPVAALYGAGPATAATLARYGIATIGQLADTPLLTVQKILGTAAGRLLHERANGIDPRPVLRQQPEQSSSTGIDFPHDELDPDRHRQAVLHLTEQLAFRMRGEEQVARRLTLTVRYADHTSTHRTRTLPEAANHTVQLARTAYDLYESLALQRARVRGLALRAEGLGPAGAAHHQLTFDPADRKARLLEAAADKARTRFGAAAVRPASLARPATARRRDVRPPA
ncbi:DNA polymerase Y family protein [Streptomyces venezuelae]|uniref:DNA polymerase Y family protein n=1 Tax=Streptomyces venezuelae TaxID=54571 RepID=UPI003434EC40